MEPNYIAIPKWMLILAYCKDKNNFYTSEIHKRLGITFSHVCKIFEVFKDKGFVISIDELSNRKKYYRLSESGMLMSNACYKLMEGFGEKIHINKLQDNIPDLKEDVINDWIDNIQRNPPVSEVQFPNEEKETEFQKEE